MSLKIDDVKRGVDIVQVIDAVTKLNKKGTTYKGLCPFHSEKSPSFLVYPRSQKYKCFGCGEQGDVLDFIQKTQHVDPKTALQLLSNQAPLMPARHEIYPEPKEDMEFVSPAPAPPRTIKHPEFGTPHQVWPYANANSELLFYVCRWSNPDGSKEVIPYTPWQKGKRIFWRFKGVPSPRPIYGLDRLRDGKTVAIFEGEKTADAAQALFPHIDCISWQGGSNAVHKTDWSPVFGKNVLIFPDCDGPGEKVLHQLHAILKDHCPVVKAVTPLATKKGWDFADWEGTGAEAIAYARANTVAVADFVLPSIQEPEQQEPMEPIEPPFEVGENSGYVDQVQHREQDEVPYRALGYQNSEHSILYWFFSNATQSILAYRSSALSKDDIIKEIAPANYWEYAFGGRNGKLNGTVIAEKLRQECSQMGVFDSTMIRGRGAWIDEGKFVIHGGTHLIVDGQVKQIYGFQTKYAYQTKSSLGLRIDKPFKPIQSAKLLEVMELFNWERKISPILAAGWCVIAPFCGTLNWRPHIWVIGGAGTGKSWILQNVIRPALGKIHVAVQSKTTEAAIRQTFEGDALPIIFDEFEAENEADAARVQSVLDLARSASSSDGGNIVKGSSGGKSTNYQIRVSFCFASIAQTIKHRSDEGRITTLALATSTPEQKQANAKTVAEVITPDFAEGLQARTISLMPVLQANVVTFSRAAATVLGDTRAGDQIGPMLAGAYLLKRSDMISMADAIAWIGQHDWSDEQPKSENRDEVRLLQTILEKQIRCDGKIPVERTVGELIYIAGGAVDSALTPDAAIDKLLRVGISAKPDGIYVSVHSNEIRKNILRQTSWAMNFPKILSRLENSVVVDSVRFSPGTTSRAVFVPKEHYS